MPPQDDSPCAGLVDIGANLAHDSFDADRNEVLERARASGVTRIIVTGSSLESSRRAAELAVRHEALYATAGVHPHHASELTGSRASELERLLGLPRVVAAGECGLDFFRDYSPRPVQEQAFRLQLELAVRTGHPLFLHQREAHERFLALLDAVFPHGAAGVAHCFTYGRGEMEAYLERGLHIGITGWICDERRGSALRQAVRHLPLERLLIETDAPYLLPRDLEPKPASRRNEPCRLPHIVAALGRWMDEDPERLARVAADNAIRLFGLDGFAGARDK